MPSPSWFNENENRAYPLRLADGNPPEPLLVDAGFVAYAKSRFETATHSVRLLAVRRQGSYFYLDFGSDAPELYGTNLTFSRHVSDGDFVSEFVDSGTAGLSTSSESGSRSASEENRDLCDEPLWSGFVVTGRMAAFETLLPADGEVSYAAAVEPALVQNLAESFVSKFAVANADRTRVSPTEGCDGDAIDDSVIHVHRYCVVGDVVLVPGYNANVRQSTQDNSITLGAAVGDGEGQPCDTVPLYRGEQPPPGSSLLEGGPRCNETVRSVNGVGGPQLNLFAGRGVTITSEPDDNRVIINVNMSGLALCFDSISERSESC